MYVNQAISFTGNIFMFVRSFLLALIILVSSPFLIFADFYKFYDESGGVSVTNDYNSIPERYRSTVIVVKAADLEKKSQAREKRLRTERESLEQQRRQSATVMKSQKTPDSTSIAAMPNDEKTETSSGSVLPTKRLGWFERQLPMLKVGSLIALFIAFAIVAGKLISSFVPRTLGLVIKIALFTGVIVYVFNAYSVKVSKAFAVLKSETEVVQKAVDKRTERIEKQDTER